jgi:hypothetical protein
MNQAYIILVFNVTGTFLMLQADMTLTLIESFFQTATHKTTIVNKKQLIIGANSIRNDLSGK